MIEFGTQLSIVYLAERSQNDQSFQGAKSSARGGRADQHQTRSNRFFDILSIRTLVKINGRPRGHQRRRHAEGTWNRAKHEMQAVPFVGSLRAGMDRPIGQHPFCAAEPPQARVSRLGLQKKVEIATYLSTERHEGGTMVVINRQRGRPGLRWQWSRSQCYRRSCSRLSLKSGPRAAGILAVLIFRGRFGTHRSPTVTARGLDHGGRKLRPTNDDD